MVEPLGAAAVTVWDRLLRNWPKLAAAVIAQEQRWRRYWGRAALPVMAVAVAITAGLFFLTFGKAIFGSVREDGPDPLQAIADYQNGCLT